MITKTSQKGQALILVALAAVGLFAFSALAIDGSRSFSNKRQAQNAADTAALTAALTYARDTSTRPDTVKFDDAAAAAEKRAASNGFEADTKPLTEPNIKVYVQRCDEPTDDQTGKPLKCDGLPIGAVKKEYMRVRIVSTISTTFGRVIGRQTLTSAAEAIARVEGGTSTSTGTTTAGAAMVATRGDDKSHCFLFNGNATLYTHDSGIFVNCSADDSFFLNGSTLFTMEADSNIVGCKAGNSGYRYTGGEINCDAEPIIVDASTYAYVPTMPAPPSQCDNPDSVAPGSYTDTDGNGVYRLSPGKYYNLAISDPTELEGGVYCIYGDFNTQSKGTLKSTSSNAVQLVLTGSINWKNDAIFENLEVFTKNGNFDVKDKLIAERLRFYSSGSGNSILNSSAYVESKDAYFYLHRGYINWNGSTHVRLEAPDDGEHAGIVVHMPWENTSASNLNGGSDTYIEGTFLMPHSQITFNGGTSFELHSQVIAYEYILDGNGEIEIYYLAADAISPPTVVNPTIELTK